MPSRSQYSNDFYPAAPLSPTGALTDFDVQASQLARRRRLAQLLQQQGMNPVHMPGNAPGSFLAPLAQMAQVWAGKSIEDETNQQEQVDNQARSQALAGHLREFPTGDIPAREENAPVGVEGEAPVGPILPAQPGQTQAQQLVPWALKMGTLGGRFGQNIADEIIKPSLQRLLPIAPDVQARIDETKEMRLGREAAAERSDTTRRDLAADTNERIRETSAQTDARMRELSKQSDTRLRELAASSDARIRELAAATIASRGSGQAPEGLTPEGRTLAASEYDRTGKMPALGTRSTADRVAIVNEAAAMREARNAAPEDVSGDRAAFKASQGALTALTKDLAAIRPYKEMLDVNGQVLKDLSKKVARTDSKLLNKPILWLQKNVTGDPDVAEFSAQMTVFQTEAARVLNNPRLVGQLTDSARHELQQIIDGTMPVAATSRVIDRMISDGQNRITAMEKEATNLRKGVGGADKGEAKTPPIGNVPPTNSKGWKLMTDKNGNRAYVSPDKKQFEPVP